MRLREKARELDVPFIVDDDVALALAVEADANATSAKMICQLRML
ncbi:hypothetical protein [Weissella sp. LMG 11983]|nr:hypothetical protein [Weissella sp. LMG 11983]MCW0925930.1 hypothetical protein [Weissella sp. LMG 11983]